MSTLDGGNDPQGAAEAPLSNDESESAVAVETETTPEDASLESDPVVDLEGEAGSEESGPDATTSGQELELYDFRRPTRVGTERLRTLTAMHDIMAASLSEWLTARFRESVDVRLGNFEETTFGSIVRRLPRPCAAYYFAVNGAPELYALIILDSSLAFASVDRLLGGSGAPHVEDRALTGLEQRVAGVIADRLRIATETIWRDHASFRLVPEGFESIPDLLQLADAADPYLAAGMEIGAQGWEGRAVVYLPFRMLESALGVGPASEADVSSPQEDRAALESGLVSASVTVDVRFPAFPLPLGVIGSLREGMVLRTRIPVATNLDVSICGQRRFVGTPGRMGQDLAVRILESARDNS